MSRQSATIHFAGEYCGFLFVFIFANEEDDSTRRCAAGSAGRDDRRHSSPDFRVLGFAFGFLGGDISGGSEKIEDTKDGRFNCGAYSGR